MFILALVYLIILVVYGIGVYRPTESRLGGFAAVVLFVIIGIALFWNILNK